MRINEDYLNEYIEPSTEEEKEHYDFIMTNQRADAGLPVLEMARIGELISGGKQYHVQVWTNDPGKYPHVHIFKEGKLDCCVRLDTNRFFAHGLHKDIMNKKMCRDFEKFMRSKSKLGITMYAFAVMSWNSNNSDVEVEVKTDGNGELIVPDYSNMQQ